MKTYKSTLDKHLDEHIALSNQLYDYFPDIFKIVALIKKTAKNNKIFLIGNGGSAADCDHFATELIVKYKKVRKAIPAISLSNNGPLITANSNDFSFDTIFERQLEALAKKNDLLIAISTSGRSKNIVKSIEYAKKNNLNIISLTGNKKNILHGKSDICIKVRSNKTSIIQEIHILLIHLICELLDR